MRETPGSGVGIPASRSRVSSESPVVGWPTWSESVRAVGAAEPGSTVKPFTILTGLESGLFEPSSIIHTAPGTLKVGRYTIRDIHNYGDIDLSTVIVKSSNVGASRVAGVMARRASILLGRNPSPQTANRPAGSARKPIPPTPPPATAATSRSSPDPRARTTCECCC